MTYIVGWDDLPAARILVPAMRILDYVSPRALEEWEYNFEEELEEERKQLLEDKAMEKVAQAQAQTSKAASAGAGKKNRGRPPTHKHTQIAAGAVAVAETEEEGARARLKAGTMSLSTPKKTRMADFDGISDGEGSPTRRVERGAESDTVMHDAGDASADVSTRGHSQAPEIRAAALLDEDIIPAHIPKVTPVPLPLQPRASTHFEQRTLPNMFSTWAARGGVSGTASTASFRTSTPAPLPVLPPLRPSNTAPLAKTPSFHTINSHTNNARPHSSSSLPALTTEPLPQRPEPSTASKPNPSPRPRSEATTASRASQKKKKKKPPLLDENGVTVWTVKRIEDEAVFEIEGQGLKTLYKVRWEGDWPPEENPTWEPAENLPKSLLRNWLKVGPQDRKRLAKGLKRKHSAGKPSVSSSDQIGGTKKMKKKQAKLNWAANSGKKLTSVSDVFENGAGEDGKDDDLDMGLQVIGQDSPVRREQDDELLVVEEATDARKGTDGKSQVLPNDRRSGFAAVMSSSWGAFFGNR